MFYWSSESNSDLHGFFMESSINKKSYCVVNELPLLNLYTVVIATYIISSILTHMQGHHVCHSVVISLLEYCYVYL